MLTSMYKTISFRSIQSVYTPAVWHINVPQRIHIFLWLMADNKALTRTNFSQKGKSWWRTSTVFTVLNLKRIIIWFFYCCVPTTMWCHLSDNFDKDLGTDFESVARWWISNNKNVVLNIYCAALMWSTWKLRNDLSIQEKNGEARRIFCSDWSKPWRIGRLCARLQTSRS